MEIKTLLEQRGLLIFDGAMGTQLQAKGLKTGETPELLNLTAKPTRFSSRLKSISKKGSAQGNTPQLYRRRSGYNFCEYIRCKFLQAKPQR